VRTNVDVIFQLKLVLLKISGPRHLCSSRASENT